MSSVDVTPAVAGDGWDCFVTVRDSSETHHHVRVSRADLARLAPGAPDPVDLVEASFAFLLEREPKESILSAFDMWVIRRYFPEFDEAFPGYLARSAGVPEIGTVTQTHGGTDS